MYSTVARRAMARVGQGRVSISSPLSEAKNDSEKSVVPALPAYRGDGGRLIVAGRPAAEGGSAAERPGSTMGDGLQPRPPHPA
jgi:hypothetical protein